MTRPLSVEFFGVPGTGKSTLIAAVAALLRAEGVPVQLEPGLPATRLRKLAAYAAFVLRHPRYTVRSAGEILASRQRSPNDLWWVTVMWFTRSWRLRQGRRDGGVELRDAGILQALWSVGFSGRNADMAGMLARLRSMVPLADQVVVVDAALPTIERRLSARPGTQSRLERGTESREELGMAARLVEQIAGELANPRGGGHVPVIRIDNDRDDALDRNARALADAIASAWRGA